MEIIAVQTSIIYLVRQQVHDYMYIESNINVINNYNFALEIYVHNIASLSY